MLLIRTEQDIASTEEFAALLRQLDQPIESDAISDYANFTARIGSPEYLRRCGLIRH